MNNTATATHTTALTALAAKAADALPKCNACGEPVLTWTKVINGHKVQARISGWAELLTFEVDGSTEPLSLTEAAERVAA